MSALPPVAEMLPHSGAACFVREIVEHGAGELRCLADVPETSPYVLEGRFPAYVLLEVAAQGTALLEAADAHAAESQPRRREGYLVRARGLELEPSGIPAGTTLSVHVKRTGKAGPMHQYEAEVVADGKTVFSGAFSTYVA